MLLYYSFRLREFCSPLFCFSWLAPGFVVQTHYEIYLETAITFVQHNLMSMQ